MKALLLFAVVLFAACGGGGGSDDPPDARVDSPPAADAAPDAPIDAPIDAPPMACTPGYMNLCNEPPPSIALTLAAGTTTINTDTDARCRVYPQAGGPEICLLYYTRIEIPAGATVVATGGRALAMASTSELLLDGTIDVGAVRARAQRPAGALVTCPGATAPEEDLGGGGGGAGGSYATAGGAGGMGDSDNGRGNDGTANGGVPGSAVAFSLLRGGCPGL